MSKKLNLRYFLIVATIAASIAIFVLSTHKKTSSLVVEITEKELIVDGDVVTKLITNPKDGYPDFPDTAYDNLQVIPLRNAIRRFANDSLVSLRILIPDTFLFAVWRPIITTAQRTKFKSLTIECRSRAKFGFFLQNATTKSVTIDFVVKLDTIRPHVSIYLNADSIIARQTESSWLYKPTVPANSRQDSIINALFYELESKERVAAMNSHYSIDELTRFVNTLAQSKIMSERVELEILPSVSCIEIVRFAKTFDSIRTYDEKLSNPIKFQDGFLKIGE